MGEIYSHGKLLISGEYLVLKGATSLASPVKFGQSLTIETHDKQFLQWTSFEKEKQWFEAKIDPIKQKVIFSSDDRISSKLQMILQEADKLHPGFLQSMTGKNITTQSNFIFSWGLGSSSSLLVNIAKLADVDAFQLHSKTSNGSGYDIACALSDTPLLFTRKEINPEIKKIKFNPAFKENLYFLYLGKKQDSEKSVKAFNNKKKSYRNEVVWISELTEQIASSNHLDNFNYYIKEHELIISSVLKKNTIKKQFFRKFEGEIKSLGAWGGDFCLVTWEGDRTYLKKYFENKNLDTLLSFDEMIIEQ